MTALTVVEKMVPSSENPEYNLLIEFSNVQEKARFLTEMKVPDANGKLWGAIQNGEGLSVTIQSHTSELGGFVLNSQHLKGDSFNMHCEGFPAEKFLKAVGLQSGNGIASTNSMVFEHDVFFKQGVFNNFNENEEKVTRGHERYRSVGFQPVAPEAQVSTHAPDAVVTSKETSGQTFTGHGRAPGYQQMPNAGMLAFSGERKSGQQKGANVKWVDTSKQDTNQQKAQRPKK